MKDIRTLMDMKLEELKPIGNGNEYADAAAELGLMIATSEPRLRGYWYRVTLEAIDIAIIELGGMDKRAQLQELLFVTLETLTIKEARNNYRYVMHAIFYPTENTGVLAIGFVHNDDLRTVRNE